MNPLSLILRQSCGLAAAATLATLLAAPAMAQTNRLYQINQPSIADAIRSSRDFSNKYAVAHQQTVLARKQAEAQFEQAELDRQAMEAAAIEAAKPTCEVLATKDGFQAKSRGPLMPGCLGGSTLQIIIQNGGVGNKAGNALATTTNTTNTDTDINNDTDGETASP